MFRNLNPKAQVKLVSEFVQAAGGNAKHTAVCEVVAKLWGAPNWNVLTGVTKKSEAISLSDDELYALVKSRTKDVQAMLSKAEVELNVHLGKLPDDWTTLFLAGECFPGGDSPTVLKLTQNQDAGRALTQEEYDLLSGAGVAVQLDVEYPESDKYGTPDEATPAGGKQYVWEELAFKTQLDFEVYGSDRGDDGTMSFVLHVKVPPELYAHFQNLPCLCQECSASLAGRNHWYGLCYDCALDHGYVSNHVPGERDLPDSEKAAQGN